MNNQFIFTNIPDIDRKILLDMDINTLSEACQINKTATKICNNSQFWKQKYLYDNIPYFVEFKSLDKWIENYKQGYIIKKKYPTESQTKDGKYWLEYSRIRSDKRFCSDIITVSSSDSENMNYGTFL